jgi:hypothetical protein
MLICTNTLDTRMLVCTSTFHCRTPTPQSHPPHVHTVCEVFTGAFDCPARCSVPLRGNVVRFCLYADAVDGFAVSDVRGVHAHARALPLCLYRCLQLLYLQLLYADAVDASALRQRGARGRSGGH